MPSTLASGLPAARVRCSRVSSPFVRAVRSAASICPRRTAATTLWAFIILIVGGILVALALLTEVRHAPPVWLP
jgi:hypothetical protein